MRYVQLDEFMKMPAGTVYMEPDLQNGQPAYGLRWPLQVKGQNCSDNDWAEFDLVECKLDKGETCDTDKMYKLFDHGESVAVDDEPVGCRYGTYPKQGEVAFIVLDEKDVDAVIGLLKLSKEWLKE